MKKWAVVGILAAVLAVCGLLIGKYQDQKYPIQPDHSNLQEEVTWWVNRGGAVYGDVVLHDYLELGDERYVLMEIGDDLGMAYLKKGMNGNYRMNGSYHGGGNFNFEEVEEDGQRYIMVNGRNAYFGIEELTFELDRKTYRMEIPAENCFLLMMEVDPPEDPKAPLRYVESGTVHFYDADGQDITSQVPWNGMRPWDGTPSVSQS